MSYGLTEFARDVGLLHPIWGAICGLLLVAAAVGLAEHLGRVERLEINAKWQERELERQRETIEQQRRALDELRRDVSDLKGKPK